MVSATGYEMEAPVGGFGKTATPSKAIISDYAVEMDSDRQYAVYELPANTHSHHSGGIR